MPIFLILEIFNNLKSHFLVSSLVYDKDMADKAHSMATVLASCLCHGKGPGQVGDQRFLGVQLDADFRAWGGKTPNPAVFGDRLCCEMTPAGWLTCPPSLAPRVTPGAPWPARRAPACSTWLGL